MLLINYTYISQAKNKETYTLTPHCPNGFSYKVPGQVRAHYVEAQPIQERVASDWDLGYPGSHHRRSLVSVIHVRQCFEVAECGTASVCNYVYRKIMCELAKPRREHKQMTITNLIDGRHASDLKCLKLQITFFPYLDAM